MADKKILLFGAGRSSIFLIEYLLKACKDYNWTLTIADQNTDHILASIAQNNYLKLINIDILNEEQLHNAINHHDFVISMLPAAFHLTIARESVNCGKAFANASYVTDELKTLENDILKKGLLFTGELGLDPGLDHMSALETIHKLKNQGAEILSFKSFTGGLVAPESDDNPWHYKISWNPRNIVLAGQGIAQFKYNNHIVFIPYHQLFRRIWEINIPGMGIYDGYPNRDSLHYEELYGLHNIPTLIRGTLRYNGFCEAWDILVQSGMTSEVIKIDTDTYSMKNIFSMFFQGLDILKNIEDILENTIGKKPSKQAIDMLLWLDIYSDIKLNKSLLSPAAILEEWLVRKWKLNKEDKDMVIMQHEFEYKLNRRNYRLTSTLVDIGLNATMTSMARLVGLPLAIYVKNYLKGNIKDVGFKIPVEKHFYDPILKELKEEGIYFSENISEVNI